MALTKEAVVPAQTEYEFDPSHAELIERCRTDPFLFFDEVLGMEQYPEIGGCLTPDQIKLVESVRDHRHTACTSGQGTGKSYDVAAIVLWFVACNEDSVVITTSASWELVENTLWREIRHLYANAKIRLGGKLLQTQLDFGEKWFVIGLSTTDPTKFQGKHAKRVLIVIDEATGVPGFIFEAAEAMAVGSQDRILATANPTDPACAFKDEIEPPDGRPSIWNRIVISCENHPNVLLRKQIIPGAVTWEWVEEKKMQWGEDSPMYDARVRGIYSTKLGRLFPDWNEARHVYDPAFQQIPDWWCHWIAIDWGFAHNSAVLFFAWDGATIYVYDEIVINDVTAGPLGDMVGRRANPRFGTGSGIKFMTVDLAHDAFGHSGETARTRAELFSEAASAHGLPTAIPASKDRVGGFNLITTLLRTDGLKVGKNCVNLIHKMPQALRDPKKPEDGLKVEGDDEVDTLYKGVLARPTEPEMTREMRLAQRITAIDPHNRAMQARIAESEERRSGASVPFVSMRRGWR
jgi:hypothetical protein